MSDQLTDLGAVPGASRDALSPVSLVIPCRPEYVALCRLVAGALGMRDGLDEEAVADVKVIVTEACNCFLAMAAGEAGLTGSNCSIRMEFDSQPDRFVISVVYPGKRELVSWLDGCDPMSEAGLGLTILRALADEMVELDTDPEGTVLRVTKLLPA
jgi:anti-sigma regulatory factor (Ser/Thr protein kinase)